MSFATFFGATNNYLGGPEGKQRPSNASGPRASNASKRSSMSGVSGAGPPKIFNSLASSLMDETGIKFRERAKRTLGWELFWAKILPQKKNQNVDGEEGAE